MRNGLVRASAAVALLLLVAAACGEGGDGGTEAEGNGGGTLVGLFTVAEGQCSDGGVTSGSYFRMVQVGGTLEEGPFFSNNDSSCGDATWTPLSPGSDGGLTTGEFQPHPDPAFDDAGNGAATAILQPTVFTGTAFSVATNETDPQSEEQTTAPSVTNTDGELSGDLSAFAAAWNGEHFNQGSPKPDGSMPGNTTAVSGTYDPDTGEYTLEWTSQIVGGAFNNFTGVWHFEGTFEDA